MLMIRGKKTVWENKRLGADRKNVNPPPVDLLSLQDPISGAFAGDSSRLEYDSRFLYCAVSCLSLLTSMESNSEEEEVVEKGASVDPLKRDPLCRLDVDKTVKAVLACHNFDGGFGTGQGAESHASQAFVSIGALHILNSIDRLGEQGRRRHEVWLSERQLPNGGLNGRPQKLEDVRCTLHQVRFTALI